MARKKYTKNQKKSIHSQTCNEQGKIFKENYKKKLKFKPEEIDYVIEHFLLNEPIVYNGKQGRVYNTPCSFDIETTSFKDGEEKKAIMYIWMLGLNGVVVIGRTWDEFVKVLKRISEKLNLSATKNLILYVHNLQFEFQWIKKLFNWINIFATDKRAPLKALNSLGFEFRCSYRLSGYNLEKTGENLLKYKCSKTHDLDYSLIRNSKTPLSEEELNYCIMDVIVVMAFIQEEIERNENKITKIPLTSTGYARQLCKNFLFENRYPKYTEYYNYMQNFKITYDEYILLRDAYMGGFTHASCEKAVNEYYENVTSYDFTSSYPAVMVAFDEYPIKKVGYKYPKSKKAFEKLCKKYTCFFEITFYDIEEKITYEHPISLSKCSYIEHYKDKNGKNIIVEDNGRLVKEKAITMTINNIDLEVYDKFYKWSSYGVEKVLCYEKGYLPSGLINAILYLYKAKTELKGVEGKEDEYQHAKALLNAIYGMCCTSILRDEILYGYETDWIEASGNFEEQIEAHNNSPSRFLHYSWGVVITSLARRNLLFSIAKLGKDYIYADTDSVKILNAEKHKDFFENYNKWITTLIHEAEAFHHLPIGSFTPKTIKGEEKPLGVWDFDGKYDLFKTLGAKRYMVFHDDVLSITVSGINKKTFIPWILEKNDIEFKEDEKVSGLYHITNNKKNVIRCFNQFQDGLIVPGEYSGKNCSTYCDYSIKGEITDYLGNKAEYNEESYVWIGKSEYGLSISDIYFEYVMSVYKLVKENMRA